MNNQLLTNLKEEIADFRVMTQKFLNKEITMKEYKGYSGGFGAYGQRGGNKLMLRLRMNQGVITKDKLAFILNCVDKYDLHHLHLTTCQTVQLHDLTGDQAADIMEEALDHGIVTRGGGGDFPRNVMCSPLSGVEMNEYFDVLPYAKAVSDYLIAEINTYKLPRKLKVAFSNSKKNKSHATFRDLGFSANEDGTFDVYSAGGLGNNPKMGLLVASHIDPTKVLYYVQAMIELFIQYGNYENRAKARTRYMQETLGEESYIEEFDKYVELVMKRGGLDFDVEKTTLMKNGTKAETMMPRMMKQKQDGLYAVSYHPIAGGIQIESLRKIQALIANMQDVELRISPNQTLYIINCTNEEALTIIEATQDGAQNIFEYSVACVGASVCQVGLRDSHNALIQLIETIRPFGFKDAVLPRIHISGCTSSCGTQQIGHIGFQGSIKLVDKKALPAFIMSINGEEKQDQETFGEIIGTILEEDISTVLIEIGKAVTNANTTYLNWMKTNKQTFMDIVKPYI